MQKYPHNGVGDATARYADDVNDLKPHLNTANHALIAAAVDNRRLGSSSATALSHASGGKPSFDDDNDDEEESMMNVNAAYHNHHHNSQMNHHHRGSSSSGNKYLVDKQPMMNNNHLAQRPGYHAPPHQDHESSGEDDEDDYKYEDEGNEAPERRRESNYSSYEAGMIGHNHRYYSNSSESYLNSAAGTPLDPASYANQQMAKKPRGELTCVVCGAAANGYNFDAITCESCKAFFRRNAFRPLNLFRCSNNNACEITIATRKKCKKCRIMKCFNLGMRRDWIMTEVEREEKRRKIAMNKTIPGVKDGPMSSMGMHHEGGSSQCSTPTHPYAPGAYGGPSSQYNSDGEYSQHQGSMNDGEGGSKPIRRRRRRRRQGGPASGGPTSMPLLDSMPDSVSPHIPTSSYNSMHPASAYSNNTNYPMSSVDQTASYMPPSQTPYYNNMDEVMAKRKKRSPGLDGSSLDDSTTALSTTATSSEEATAAGKSLGLLEQYKNVNRDKIVISDEVELKARVTDLERKQIEAIQEAYKQAIRLVKAQGIPKTSEDLNTTINLTELGVRRLIFFFKLISDFRNLDHDLMVKLLKRNMMNLIQIHGVNSYNRKEDIFKEPDSDDAPFSASSLESIYGPDIYKLTIGITQNLYDLCDGDMTYIKILLLIVIFDPMNDTLSDEERLQIVRLQNKYVTLLHAFLCDSFGKDKGAITFKSLLYEMNKVNDLAQWFERVVAEKSNYEYVRPLMKEVFSLPTQSASGMNTASASTPEASTPPASVSMASSVAAPSSNLPTTG